MTMRIQARGVALCAGVPLVVLTASTPASAANKQITGKLDKPGYTVIALAADGEATSARTQPRKFKLHPPARRVTLHLRAKDGTYAGPIVIGKERKGKRAILGVKAGAKLGRVEVKAGKGYAKVKKKLAEQFVDAKRQARAKRGVPIGAGKFGRVLSKKFKGGAPGDRDLDGLPDPLDIDDDGDLIIDTSDSSTARGGARVAQGDVCGPNNIYCAIAASGLGMEIYETTNANALTAAGFTPARIDQEIDDALPAHESLRIDVLPGDSAELDCAARPNPNPPPDLIPALIYCSPGGTGRVAGPNGAPFPGDPGGPFDRDGDGFGTLDPSLGGGCQGCTDFFLVPGATTDQIGTGDVLIERVTTGGVESLFPRTLPYVFATVPALVSYSDTAGNCAKVAGTPGSCATEFSYPVASPTPGCPPPGCAPGGPGTVGNGFPVDAGPGGDVVLTLTFWRPQRELIPPETADWIDIGNLRYTMGPIYNPNDPSSQATTGPCPQSAFPSWGPNLTPETHPIQGFGLRDSAADQTASVANTVTYTFNVTQCLATGFSWDSGEELRFQFEAGNGADSGGQGVVFRRQ